MRFCVKNPYYDDETGLHYNWHRYYNPTIGRYLTPDPIGLDGGINLYAYVQNDPVNYIDPYGLVHLGFANMLRNMANKSVRKTIKSLEKRILKHEEAARRGLTVGIIGFIGSLLDPFGAEALANPEADMDGNGIPDYLEQSQNVDPCK